jgi:hypothetical protein
MFPCLRATIAALGSGAIRKQAMENGTTYFSNRKIPVFIALASRTEWIHLLIRIVHYNHFIHISLKATDDEASSTTARCHPDSRAGR